MANSSFTKGTIATPVSPENGGTGLSSLGTAGQILATNTGETAVEWITPTGAVTESTQVSGEAIAGATTPVPVCYKNTGIAATQIIQATSNSAGDIYGALYRGQTFTTSGFNRITKVSFYGQKVGSPTGNLVCNIYATSAGVPTGASLGSKTLVASDVSASSGYIEFVFDTPITVTDSSVYAMTFGGVTGNSSNRIQSTELSTSAYAGGAVLTSSNSGSSWSAGTGDQRFIVTGYQENNDGKVYIAKANDSTLSRYVGLATTTVAGADLDITVASAGIVEGFTGLTKGAAYYISDSGTVSVTPGTYRVQVGVATSATEMLISGYTGKSGEYLKALQSKSNGTTYQADSDGFILCFPYDQPTGGSAYVQIGPSSANTTVARAWTQSNTYGGSCCVPVPKGYFWATTNMNTVYWLPFGN